MRVLSQGQADLFDLAFARLLDLELEVFRKCFYEKGARNVALSCRAAGIDRAVFPTVFNLSRQGRGISAALTAADTASANAAFANFTKDVALAELKAGLSH
jgi:hypothetical protein